MNQVQLLNKRVQDYVEGHPEEILIRMLELSTKTRPQKSIEGVTKLYMEYVDALYDYLKLKNARRRQWFNNSKVHVIMETDDQYRLACKTKTRLRLELIDAGLPFAFLHPYSMDALFLRKQEAISKLYNFLRQMESVSNWRNIIPVSGWSMD